MALGMSAHHPRWERPESASEPDIGCRSVSCAHSRPSDGSSGWFSDLLAVAPGLLLKTTLDPVRAAQLREASPVAGGRSDAERAKALQ